MDTNSRNSPDTRTNSRSRRNALRAAAFNARKQEPATSAEKPPPSQKEKPSDASVTEKKHTGSKPKPFKPKFEKKESVPNNDNMYEFPCLGSLVPDNRYYGYNHDHSSYILVIKESYRHLCTQNGRLARQMPFCIYQHYCIELLFARMFYVQDRFARGFSIDVPALLTMMKAHDTIVPSEITEYLKTYAEFQDPLGNYWRPNMPDIMIPQATANRVQGGSFGAVTAANHNAYEVCPAPIVSAQRIRADMAGANAMVPLPNGGLLNPTRNLLGFEPLLVPLHRDALSVIADVQFSSVALATRVQHSVEVFNICNSALKETRNAKTDIGIPVTVNTGVSAFDFVETTEGDVDSILYDAEVSMYGRSQLFVAEIGKLLMFTPRRSRTVEQPGFCDLTADGEARPEFAATVNSYFNMTAPFAPVRLIQDPFINDRRFRLPGGGSRIQLIGNWVNQNFSLRQQRF